MLQFPGYPIRLQRCGAHQHRETHSGLDRRLDLTPQRITALELPRIDPHLLLQILQGLPQLPHKAVVG
jgi:hypothetical protein